MYELSYTVHGESVDIDELIEELKNCGLRNSYLVEDQQTLIQIVSRKSSMQVVRIIKKIFEELAPDSPKIRFHLSKFEKGSTQNYEFSNCGWQQIK